MFNLQDFMLNRKLKKQSKLRRVGSDNGMNINSFTDTDFANCVRVVFPDGKSGDIKYKQMVVKSVDRSNNHVVVTAERPYIIGDELRRGKYVCIFSNSPSGNGISAVLELNVNGEVALMNIDKNVKNYFSKIVQPPMTKVI